jgi:hypothetical protein
MLRAAGLTGWERLVAAAGLALLIRGALHGGAVLLIAGAVLLVGSAARPALRWWRRRARITGGPHAAIAPSAAHHLTVDRTVAQAGAHDPSSARLAGAVKLRLATGVALPIAGYLALQVGLGNSTTALATTEAIPVAWLVVVAITRRRVEPVAVAVFVVFAIALVLTATSGGSSLPLKLKRAAFPGALGLACLISIAVRKPLLIAMASRRAGSQPALDSGAAGLGTPAGRRALTVLTVIAGVTFTADAVAQVALALSVSTTTFVVAARIASYAIFAGGGTAGALYIRHVRRRHHISGE